MSRKLGAPHNHIQLDTISITGDPLTSSLSGSEVVGYEGWEGSPKTKNEKFAIGAVILVKEDWIKFSDVSIKKNGRLGARLSAIFQRSRSKKAEYFKLLLAYLCRIALQDPDKMKFATLACAGLVFVPRADDFEHFNGKPQREKLVFHPALIEQFDRLPSGKHGEFVREVISAEAPTDEYFLVGSASSNFRIKPPLGSPFDAIKHLSDLQTVYAKLDKDALNLQIATIPRNVRRDLTALGFLRASRGRTVDSFAMFQGTARSALLFEVSRTDWFTFGAGLLENFGLRFPAFQVGFEVSEEFGLDWAESSQRRYGHSIKRWIAILHPKFAELNKDHVDYYYVRSLKAQAAEKGAIPIIDVELAAEIEYRKLKGQTYLAIASQVGLSPQTYTNWRSQNPIDAAEAIKAATQRIEKEDTK